MPTFAERGMGGQARQTTAKIGAVLSACGLGFDSVVKCAVMLADLSEWSQFNKIDIGCFRLGRPPARSAFGCNGLGLGAKLEVGCMARHTCRSGSLRSAALAPAQAAPVSPSLASAAPAQRQFPRRRAPAS